MEISAQGANFNVGVEIEFTYFAKVITLARLTDPNSRSTYLA